MIRRVFGKTLALAALALTLSACGGGEQQDGGRKPVVFSILSTENSQNQETLWAPFIADMEKQTGLDIRPFFASNYTSLIEAMRFNQVQVGWFSNQSGLEAVRRADGEVFVRSSDPSGVDGYFSIIIAAANSKLTLDDLLKCDRRLSFGLGDAKSTSGTLAPVAYLFGPRRIDPAACFSTVRSANHEANMLAVANGLLDAATNNSTAFRLTQENRPEVASKLKVIWQSPRLPEDPIVWRKDLDPSTKEKIRSFFLTYGTAPGEEGERQRRNLAQLSFGVFKPADNSHLIPVREMEATAQLIEARNRNDAEGVAKAEQALAAIRQERAAVAPAPQLPADPQPEAAQ
jgi:phosphonate transport system substrate-binding protein